jgi:hypothetical protein
MEISHLVPAGSETELLFVVEAGSLLSNGDEVGSVMVISEAEELRHFIYISLPLARVEASDSVLLVVNVARTTLFVTGTLVRVVTEL